MQTFTSGCSNDVLTITDEGVCLKNGQRMVTEAWPEAVESWRSLINKHAIKHDVPPSLIAGVMAQESRGNPKAGSPVGAIGLMQVMPQYFGGNAGGRLYDPETNVNEGVGYLAKLWTRYEGNYVKMLAGYNAGHTECRVAKVWGLRQDDAYIDKCLGYANHAITLGFSAFRPSERPLGASSSPNWAPVVAFAAGLALYLAADHAFDLSDRIVEAIS